MEEEQATELPATKSEKSRKTAETSGDAWAYNSNCDIASISDFSSLLMFFTAFLNFIIANV